MKAGQKPSAWLHCAGRVCIVLSCLAAASNAVADPSALEILERVKEQMAPPVQYRLQHDGGVVEAFSVSQKILADGSLASRIEYPAAISNFTTLIYRDRMFTFFANEQMAIDLSYRASSVSTHAEALAGTVASLLDGRDQDSPVLLERAKRGDVECYQIEISSGLPRDAADVQGGAGRRDTDKAVVAGHRFVIEKDALKLVEIAALSPTGSVLSKRTYYDVRTNPVLQDDFFQVPEGTEILTAASNREYGEAVSTVLKKLQADRLVPILPPLIPQPVPPPPRPIPTRDDLRRIIEKRGA